MTDQPPAVTRRSLFRLLGGAAALAPLAAVAALKVCPKCGMPNPGASMFCANCFWPLKKLSEAAPARAPSEPQRRRS